VRLKYSDFVLGKKKDHTGTEHCAGVLYEGLYENAAIHSKGRKNNE